MATSAFAYEAQTQSGQSLTGTIEAASAAAALQQLTGLGLRVLTVAAAEPASAKMRRTLGTEDFLLFNQQLAHLTAAGLPVEYGLRLIAADVQRGKMAAAANDVAADLERGLPLGEAFALHAHRFPALYSRIVEAGVQAGNLPGLLFNLGRHLELVARLRKNLWRILAYPCVVFTALLGVVLIMSVYVLPQFREIFKDFRTTLPMLTELLLMLGQYMPAIILGMFILLLLVLATWVVLVVSRKTALFVDWFILPMPLIGRVIRLSLLARWCDALKLGVESGIDLPKAFGLAGDAVGSPRLAAEGSELAAAMSQGQSLLDPRRMRLIPPAVPAAIELGSRTGDLPSTLGTLALMYEQQAEHRLRFLPTILTPIFLIILSVTVGITVLAMFLPLVKLIQSVD